MKRFFFLPEPEGPVPLHENLRVALGITGLVILLLVALYFGYMRRQRAAAEPQSPPALIVVVTETGTAVPATEMALLPSATAASTETAVPTATAMPTDTRTPLPPATALPTPPPSPPPTAAPGFVTATCIEPAILFAGPGARYEQLTPFVDAGEAVRVVGLSENRFWMLIEKNGEQGWVAASFFEVSQAGLDRVPVITESGGEATPVELPPVAYWTEIVDSRGSIGGEQWKVDLSVRVPASGNYQFRMAGRAVSWQFHRELENGYALYTVTLSGMDCNAPLIGALTVLRDGGPLALRNESTGESGDVFVSAPSDC